MSETTYVEHLDLYCTERKVSGFTLYKWWNKGVVAHYQIYWPMDVNNGDFAYETDCYQTALAWIRDHKAKKNQKVEPSEEKIIEVAEQYLADEEYSPMFATNKQIEMVTEAFGLKDIDKLEALNVIWHRIWNTLTAYAESDKSRWFDITDARSALLEIVNIRAREIKKALAERKEA